MRKIEWATEKGSKVTMEIITESENLSDHNFKNDCFELSVKIDGNSLGPIELTKGIFIEKFPEMINGKLSKRGFKSNPESLRFYSEYQNAIKNRIDKWNKSETDYQKHSEKMRKAMVE